MLGRLLVLAGILTLGSLLVSEAARRQAGESLREITDRLLMLGLRGSSGFAANVNRPLQEEERERRLRWR